MQLKNKILNSLYFVTIFIVALVLTTLSLARRTNSFESSRDPLLLNVDKEDIQVANSTAGSVTEILVEEGEHVTEGQVLMRLNNDVNESRIAILQQFEEENLSARTEANLLRAESERNEITSPRDAVVYGIHTTVGTFISQNSDVMTLFSDDNLKLTGLVSAQRYAEILEMRSLAAYSPRLQQVYSVNFEGVGKVFPATKNEPALYEIIFRFAEPGEGAVFVEGETLEITGSDSSAEIWRPSTFVTKFWNLFIIGQ